MNTIVTATELINKNAELFFKEPKNCFKSAVDPDLLYKKYLASFPKEENRIFIERPIHDCNTCKQFIKNVGVLVRIVDGKLETVWGNSTDYPYPYDIVFNELDKYIKKFQIKTIFYTQMGKYGTSSNHAVKLISGVKRDFKFNHLWATIPSSLYGEDFSSVVGHAESRIHTLKRGLNEIPIEVLKLILELSDTSKEEPLYRGAQFSKSVKEFLGFAEQWRNISNEFEKNIFLWSNLHKVVKKTAFRASAIGSLALALAKEDLTLSHINKCVLSYESKVSDDSYQRTSALVSEKFLEDSLERIDKLGYTCALNRRIALKQDMGFGNPDIMYASANMLSKMKSDLLKSIVSKTKPVNINEKSAVDININEFVKMIPKINKLEVYIDGLKHEANFVTLTTNADENCKKSLFSYDNPFCLSYNGNMADSARLKNLVKDRGGKVDGILRASILWETHDDYDLHATITRNDRGMVSHIYFSNKRGILDVDANAGRWIVDPVENMNFTKASLMKGDIIDFWVTNYAKRNSPSDLKRGVIFEIEFLNTIRRFNYKKTLPKDGNTHAVHISKLKYQPIHVRLKYLGNDDFEFVDLSDRMKAIESSSSSLNPDTIWNIPTNRFVEVESVLLSPNYWGKKWDSESKYGNKHFLLMLHDCVNPNPVRGFYNEFISSELKSERKTLDLLADKLMCEPNKSFDQLSGIGISESKGDSLILRVNGGRLYNIKIS